MKLKRKHVFLFWGGMDLFYLIQFLGWNLYHQRLPFYDDILSYLQLVPTLGLAAAWLFPLNVLLIVTIPVSMVLLWRQSRYALRLACAQTPLRLAFMLPSLSMVLWGAQVLGVKGAAFFIALLLVSEAAKLMTLWRWRKI